MAYTYIGIAALCFLPGASAGIFHLYLSKRQHKTIEPGKTIFFYSSLFYGFLSLVKMILDGGEKTLPESFADILPATYLHYMIPILFLVIAVPCLFHLILRRVDLSRFLSLFDSLIFFLLAWGFIFTNRICHSFYAAAMCTSLIASLSITCLYKKEITFCTTKELKKRIRYAAPTTLLYVATVLLSLPGTLFLNNRSEIPVSFSSFAWALIAGSFVYFAILAAGSILLLTRRQFKLFHILLFAVTFMGYLQNMFLNGHLTSMDGNMQHWDRAKLTINALVWIVFILGIVLIRIRLTINVDKIYRIICTYLCLVQIVSLGILAVSTNLGKSSTQGASGEWFLSTEKSLTLHPDNNVLVFILDWYDGQILEQILKQEPDFLQPLDGFTSYTNATSLYAFTEWSLPYLLTQVPWQYGMDKDEYREYAFKNSHMLQDICESGFDAGVYTDLKYMGEGAADQLCNYVFCEQYCPVWDTVSQMLKCSKYQLAPFAFKNLYWYTTDEISALSRNDTYTRWITYNDVPFWEDLKKNGLDIDQNAGNQGSFRFYHMYGAHFPYVMSQDCTETEQTDMVSQAKGSMKIVYEYISQLKALGLYDNATIIITADHGQNYTYDPMRTSHLADIGLNTTSYPILLVKNAKESGEGVKRSEAPVSHTEVIATIVNAVNPQIAENYGNTLDEIDENAKRERIFTYMRKDMPYVQSAINGHAGNPDDWTVKENKAEE